MNVCTHCGFRTPGGRFCAECGAPFAPVESAPDQQTQAPPLFPSTSRSQSVRSEPGFASTAGVLSAVPVDYGQPKDDHSACSQRSQSARSYRGDVDISAKVGHGGFAEQPERGRRGRSTGSSGSFALLKGRYADHPSCDVCDTPFDVTRRRHQCRSCGRFICGACSPRRLLIPEGEQIDGARGYDPAEPQRVCVHCVPLLAPVQDELVARVARSNQLVAPDHDDESSSKNPLTRVHVPFSPSLEKECRVAADILGNFFRFDDAMSNDRVIPISLLENAHGLAVMTIVKAGFLVVGKIGTGLVIARLPDGSWSAPSAIGTIGLGGGFEIGGEIVEVMIILGSPAAVKVFHAPQVNLGAGLDVAVGPYGRSATAAAAVSSTGLNANYSYSMSKGLYAGVSLQGSVIATRNDMNRKFYGRELEPSELLSGSIDQPAAAKPLYDALDVVTRGLEEQAAVREELSAMMGTCRACSCAKYVAHTRQVWYKKCKACGHAH